MALGLARQAPQILQCRAQVLDQLLGGCQAQRLLSIDVDREVIEGAIGALEAGQPHGRVFAARCALEIAEPATVLRGLPRINPFGRHRQQNSRGVIIVHKAATYRLDIARLCATSPRSVADLDRRALEERPVSGTIA